MFSSEVGAVQPVAVTSRSHSTVLPSATRAARTPLRPCACDDVAAVAGVLHPGDLDAGPPQVGDGGVAARRWR